MQTTGSVSPDEQGALLGLEHALFSCARVFAPVVATAVLSTCGIAGVAAACAAIDALLAAGLSFTSTSSTTPSTSSEEKEKVR